MKQNKIIYTQNLDLATQDQRIVIGLAYNLSCLPSILIKTLPSKDKAIFSTTINRLKGYMYYQDNAVKINRQARTRYKRKNTNGK